MLLHSASCQRPPSLFLRKRKDHNTLEAPHTAHPVICFLLCSAVLLPVG